MLKKVGYIVIAVAAIVSTFVIIVKSHWHPSSFERSILVWHLFPYPLMLCAFSKVREDKFMIYHLFASMLAVVGSLLLLIDAAYISPSPLAFLIIPLVQLLAFVFFNLIVAYLPRFAEDKNG